ncbi:hypothetical protein H4R34_002822 [Dimargaris verticillata]|uniref:Superoxide dismutase copper/zinc binding domain-containing protein n=1 Tax=Dimargaris verticillata TaxID=2761393 RepID=A0A9W8B7F7_9FUNG|nr:hypothetical protein H4R34_002822 [Dimargaris verticillata]
MIGVSFSTLAICLIAALVLAAHQPSSASILKLNLDLPISLFPTPGPDADSGAEASSIDRFGPSPNQWQMIAPDANSMDTEASTTTSTNESSPVTSTTTAIDSPILPTDTSSPPQPTVVSAFANIHRTKYASIHGFVSFVPSPAKQATFIKIALNGLVPNATYKVHIHRNVVSSLSNSRWDCEQADGHFDPLNIKAAGELTYQCDPLRPKETCELGDISGKFGDVVATKYGSYIRLIDTPDPHLTLVGEFGVLQRSVVVHNKDGQRVACGNIAPMAYA